MECNPTINFFCFFPFYSCTKCFEKIDGGNGRGGGGGSGSGGRGRGSGSRGSGGGGGVEKVLDVVDAGNCQPGKWLHEESVWRNEWCVRDFFGQKT